MKYAIRRALVALISMPLIAGAYVFLYLVLVMSGGESNINLATAMDNGLLIASVCAVFLTFYPQIARYLDRLI